MTKFVKGKNLSADNIAKQYATNERYRKNRKRSNSVLLEMTIISFHPDDYERLQDNRILKSIAREFIKKRAPHAMATVVVHRNKKGKEKTNVHLHIAISGTNYRTGESVRVSIKQYNEDIKFEMEQFQRTHFPFLKASEISHNKNSREIGKGKIKDSEYKMKQKRGIVSDKLKTLELLEQAYMSASSKLNFYKTLIENNIELYSYREKYVGLKVNGRKHRFRKLGYLPEALDLLNDRGLSLKKRHNELQKIKNRQKKLPKDWER